MNPSTTHPPHAILAAVADLGGTATAAQLRRLLGHRPDPADLTRLQTATPGRPARIVQPRTGVYHLTAAGLRELARRTNLDAVFLPADADSAAPADADDGTHPSLCVAGAQAFLYLDADGVLTLSLHLDTGEVPAWLSRPDHTVPLRVTVNGTAVFVDARPALRTGATDRSPVG